MTALTAIIQENMKDRGMVPDEWSGDDSACLAEAITTAARKQKAVKIQADAELYIQIYCALKGRAAEAHVDFHIQSAATTLFIAIQKNGNGR